MAGLDMDPDSQSPFMIERMLRLWRLGAADEEVFTSEAEFKAGLMAFDQEELMQRYLASIKDKPREMAQEFAFQAYEADSEDAAQELTDKALELDPACVDALTIQAFLASDDSGELIPGLEQAATCGENALGEEFFSEFKGDFWPMVEARPYMRCIKQLAEVLWNVGRRLDVVAHYENLLDMDPEDHMGNGVLLLGHYLSMGEVQRSWDLLEEIDDDSGAVFNWAWVLLFLMINDEEGAREALDHALDMNPYVAPLLIGLGGDEELELPGSFITGSKEEAHFCIRLLGEAWAGNLTAHWWLLDILREMGLVTAEDAPQYDEPEAAD